MSELLWLSIGCGAGLLLISLVVLAIRQRQQEKTGTESESSINHTVERITALFPALHRYPSKSAGNNQESILGLQGNLSQTPLPDLLQYLALGHKSGILELTCGRRSGRIVMQAGRVAKSFYRGKDGLEALYSLLDLSQGDFEFFEYRLNETEFSENFDVVDIIMLWMEKKTKKKSASK